MTLRRGFAYILIVAAIGVLATSCASMRDTGVYHFYHNVTARFNGYFNAKEKTMEQELLIWQSHRDNFAEILPIFIIPDDAMTKQSASAFDAVITKTARVIKKHKDSKWVDDSYLLMGIAYYYKKDYYAADEAFFIVTNDYKDGNAAPLAQLWLARNALANNKLSDAQARLSEIRTNKKAFPPELEYLLLLTEAQYHIQNKSYDRAAQALEKAMPMIKGKRFKIRYYFILAQLKQHQEQDRKAEEYYHKVLKRNPPYEFAFQSRIGLTYVSKDPAAMRKSLERMLKDDKNKDYFDQIYYHLARIDIAQRDTAQAIEHLKQATATESKNPDQALLNYKMLGDLHFQTRQYPLSKRYYDTAQKVIDPKSAGYAQFMGRQKILGRLIDNLIVYELNDSLLRLAKMPEEERIKRVDQLIKEDKQRALRGAADPNFYTTNNLDLGSQQATNQGVDYFYNATAMAQGEATFRKLWGPRTHGDNWRRLSALTSQQNVPKVVEERAFQSDDTLSELRGRYMENIPVTPSQQYSALTSMQNAMFNVANIYHHDIADMNEAARFYHRLVSQYPDNQHAAPSYYSLYQIHAAHSRTAEADYNKNIVLDRFPDSEEAEMIRNPESNRFRTAKAGQNTIARLYDSAYRAFQSNNCLGVSYAFHKAAFDGNAGNELPKFKYLHLICQLKQDTVPALVDSLEAFREQFKDHYLGRQAEIVLRAINKQQPSPNIPPPTNVPEPDPGKDIPGVPFSKDTGKHFFIVVVPANADINKILNSFSNYHATSFPAVRLKARNTLLDKENALIIVESFKNKREAGNYYQQFDNNPAMKATFDNVPFTPLLISDINYALFLTEKNVERYKRFFRDNYL